MDSRAKMTPRSTLISGVKLDKLFNLTFLSLSFIYEWDKNRTHLIEMVRELNELIYVVFRRVMA